MISISKLIIITSLLAPNTIQIKRAIDELPNINQVPRMITMSLYNNDQQEMAFNWNTSWNTDTFIQLNENEDELKNDKSNLEFEGTVEKSKVANDGFIHRVVAKELKANTVYYYRVGDKEADVWSDIGSFKTAAENKVGAKFVHISDPQGYEEIHYQNYNELLNLASTISNPDFFCLTGDIVNDSYYDSIPKLEQWDWALTDQSEIMMNYPFMTTAGNHEAAVNDYNSRFNHPVSENNYHESGSYYSFTYQGINFISLNTNDSNSSSSNAKGLSDAQMNWLENELKNNTSTFTIVMMHKGIYDAGGHSSNKDGADYDIPLIRKQLSPLFTKYNVDLVLQGHDHLFSRSYPLNGKIDGDKLVTTYEENTLEEIDYNNSKYNVYTNPKGTIYFNTGTASGSKYYSAVDYDKEEIPLEKVDSPAHRMFTEFVIENNTLYATTYKIINNEAVVFDTFGIKKTNDPNNNPNISDDDNKNNDHVALIIALSVISILALGGGITMFIIKKNKKKSEGNLNG